MQSLNESKRSRSGGSILMGGSSIPGFHVYEESRAVGGVGGVAAALNEDS